MIEYLWAVEVTEPPTENRQWARPRRYLVVAETLEKAVELTTRRHPNVTLIKVIRDRNVDDVFLSERDFKSFQT